MWADSVRKAAEALQPAVAADGFAVLDDPGYAQALRMGAWFEDAAAAVQTALEAAGGGDGGLPQGCPCRAVCGQ